ncbi:MAG TPA: response regulator [bacterium]|nr:response regulator [bacterium]HQL63499.1 response regulator [bacterium]
MESLGKQDKLCNPSETPQRTGLHILLVEDNIVNQKIASAMLSRQGHSVVIARHGLEALDMIENDRFDLIFMDVLMPEMDGYQATSEIRKRELGTHVPIIAMTACAMVRDREKCMAAGMDDYITKPIQLADLEQAIARAIPLADRGGTKESAMRFGDVPDPVPDVALDVPELMDRVDHNRNLLSEIVAMFVRESCRLMDRIQEAIENHDAQSLAASAHALKGAIGNFATRAAHKAASKLEKLGLENSLQNAPEVYRVLEIEVDRLREALLDLCMKEPE